MSAPVLTSSIDLESPESKARTAHNRALAEELRAKVAEAALGGSEASRHRHTASGKLLPRERVERLLDPGSPFLEIGQLAANGLYGGEVPGAGAPLTIQNPEIVLGATPDASGLYGQVNGVRIKVGDLDTDALDLDVANGTVTIKQLKATVSGALAPLLNGVLGTGLIQSGTPLLSLDLSFPQL